jgi:osmoprotectant transport system permease protein
VILSLTAVLVGLSVSGALDGLSLIKEWHANEELFARSLIEHIKLAISTTLAAAFVAIPIGFWIHHRPHWANGVKFALHFIHTIPSLALFGLLMLPLSALSQRFEWLSDAGVHGIGVAPAWCALCLYACLPMFSTVLNGLENIDAAVVEAGVGLGFNRWQRFYRIEWPLCQVSVFNAFAVTLVQMMGLASIAALIGGGGLGTFIFNGIGQNAPDLVLLGTLGVSFCALLAQSLLGFLTSMAARHRQ